uniref:hypothetical protein n=1 Tax=Pseudoclavibacter sp. RFBI5 TaxID=2080578 RepID=UPI0015E4340E|nr:hypothetical protein [Pseudoclavibacter sp. RFBI5]
MPSIQVVGSTSSARVASASYEPVTLSDDPRSSRVCAPVRVISRTPWASRSVPI